MASVHEGGSDREEEKGKEHLNNTKRHSFPLELGEGQPKRFMLEVRPVVAYRQYHPWGPGLGWSHQALG